MFFSQRCGGISTKKLESYQNYSKQGLSLSTKYKFYNITQQQHTTSIAAPFRQDLERFNSFMLVSMTTYKEIDSNNFYNITHMFNFLNQLSITFM